MRVAFTERCGGGLLAGQHSRYLTRSIRPKKRGSGWSQVRPAQERRVQRRKERRRHDNDGIGSAQTRESTVQRFDDGRTEELRGSGVRSVLANDRPMAY